MRTSAALKADPPSALIEASVGRAGEDRRSTETDGEADRVAVGALACVLTIAVSLSTLLGLMRWWL